MVFFAHIVIALCLSLPSLGQTTQVWPAKRPKLTVIFVIDQFRSDYLSRFSDSFGPDGFKPMMKNGAYFPWGQYDVLQSMTGPGHATILTGAYPYQMGIPANDWYDKNSGQEMYCVQDRTTELVGGPSDKKDGFSPKNLIGSTVGDELKNIDVPARVVSIALKDRAAILMGGHRADLALWFHSVSNSWVSSKYYLPEGKLPGWVQKLNETAQKTKCPQDEPCGLEMTIDAAVAAVDSYKLGQTANYDVLAVSLSSHDYAGHKYGPNSVKMKEMTIADDKALGRLRRHLASKVTGGLQNVLMVLTADHGIVSSPDYLAANKIASQKISEADLAGELEGVLEEKFGKVKPKKWIAYVSDFSFYLDPDVLKKNKTNVVEVESLIKQTLQQKPYFAQVFTRTDYEQRKLPPGMFERQILRTYYPGRSGDVVAIVKPFYINDSKNLTTHMTGYAYDRTVPIILTGPGIKPGVYAQKAEVVDIAPTISFLLGTVAPALSEGRVLHEILR